MHVLNIIIMIANMSDQILIGRLPADPCQGIIMSKETINEQAKQCGVPKHLLVNLDKCGSGVWGNTGPCMSMFNDNSKDIKFHKFRNYIRIASSLIASLQQIARS